MEEKNIKKLLGHWLTYKPTVKKIKKGCSKTIHIWNQGTEKSKYKGDIETRMWNYK